MSKHHRFGIDLSTASLEEAITAAIAPVIAKAIADSDVITAWLAAQNLDPAPSLNATLDPKRLEDESPQHLREVVLHHLRVAGKKSINFQDLWESMGFEYRPKSTIYTGPAKLIFSCLQSLATQGLISESVKQDKKYWETRDCCDNLCAQDREILYIISNHCTKTWSPMIRANIGKTAKPSISTIAADRSCEKLRASGLINMQQFVFQSEDGRGGGSRFMVWPSCYEPVPDQSGQWRLRWARKPMPVPT